MEISRNMPLPVSYDVAHKQLTAAFAAPIVVQKGNLALAKIVYEGQINGQTILIHYREYGRSLKYYELTGRLVDDPAGARLLMTMADGISPYVRFAPLAMWVTLWVVTQVQVLTGLPPLSVGKLLLGCVVAFIGSALIKKVLDWHLRTAALHVEKTLLKIVTDAR